MLDVASTLIIQSFCFGATKDPAAVADKLKSCGSTRMELSGAHIKFAEDHTFDRVIADFRSHGIEIASIGVATLTGDDSADRKVFQCARKAAVPWISVDFPPAGFPHAFHSAARLADEYDVRLAIHNHGGRHWLGNLAMLRHVMSVTSDRIGVCLDTGWTIDSGEDPLKLIEELGPRIYGVHLRDFVYDRDRTRHDVPAGSGNLDLAAVRDALRKIDFNGYAVLEYSNRATDPTPFVAEAVRNIRAAFTV